MAQQLACDICQEEPAAQMLTNVENGQVMTLGLNCLPVFYGQSILTLLNAGDHKGPANKCQACRRFHERMTTPAHPIGIEPDHPTDTNDGTSGSHLADDIAAAYTTATGHADTAAPLIPEETG